MSVFNHRPSTVNLNQLVSNIPVRRKAADQVERDKFEWSQWQSATKAINSVESPAKEKHVRNLILGTFRLEGARLFWSMMTRLQLESHPIVCWKFCFVIHRLLRDGHRHVVNDSIPLAPYFEQLGKFWSPLSDHLFSAGSAMSALRQHYGMMTYRYCRLMISKLTFHERNPQFNGNLLLGEQNDIRRILNDNLDGYFQLCIELLDYMEELLGLVDVIFTSLDQSRANSMTTAGQCRLHPLIICVQDSSLLYDYIVKVLFKLHESLPGDTLQGHRQRLIEQFRRLKRFYEQASTLQYFKDLIKIPTLPESPPNFKIKDDIKNYQPPVAIVHEPQPEPAHDNDAILIDTSDDARDLASAFPTNDDWPPNGHMIDRSKEITDLEQRLLKCDAMLRENRSETEELHRRIAAKDTELATERNHRLQLEDQLRQQLDNQRRVEEMHALEKKSNSDDKFNKLLEAYNKLREEHIVVLRREGEVKKQLANLNQEHTSLKDAHKKMEDEFQRFKTDYEQLKNQKQEEVQQEILQLRQTNDEISTNMNKVTYDRDRLKKELEDNKIRLHEKNNQYQNLEKTAQEQKDHLSTLENTIENLTREVNDKKQVLQREMTSFENQSKILVEHEVKQQESEQRLTQMSKLINEYETNARENEKKLEEVQLINKNLEDTLQKKSNEFNQKLTSVQQKLHEVEQKHQDSLALINQLNTVNSTNDAKLIESNGIITDLKHVNEHLNSQLKQSNRDKEQYENELNQLKILMEKRENELQERIMALTNERNNYQTTTVESAERIKEIEHVKQSVENRYKELENEKSLINSRLENDKAEFEKRLKEAEFDREELLNKNRQHEENLIDLCHEKEELEHKIIDLENATREWAQKFVNTTDNQKLMHTNHANMMNNLKQQYKYSILTHCINQMHEGIERTKDVELLSCKSGAEYLLAKLRAAVNGTKTTQDLWKKQLADESSTIPFLNECITLANNVTDIVVHGKATSNLIQDVDQSSALADHCRDVTLQCIDLYTNYQTPSDSIDFDKQSSELMRRLNNLIDKATTLLPKGSDISKEELGDLVEKELQSTHETIDQAVRQLEAMMAKSREQDTGIKCEVNGQILDSCGKLMQTIRILIIKARDLQKEIVAQGRGTASAREFYTKNHKWTEGLVSAAKNVGLNAKVLIESADHLLSGTGKFEEIIACSQEIAASTAQLVAASNVKADRESKNREALSHASKSVNTSTAQVVATAKNCAAIIEEKSTMDFSTLNLHQTKRKEMDAQVKVLELEKALEQAKQLLYKLRKQHYQMAGEEAGWSQEDAANSSKN